MNAIIIFEWALNYFKYMNEFQRFLRRIEYYFEDPEDETYESKFVNTGRSVESCKSLQTLICEEWKFCVILRHRDWKLLWGSRGWLLWLLLTPMTFVSCRTSSGHINLHKSHLIWKTYAPRPNARLPHNETAPFFVNLFNIWYDNDNNIDNVKQIATPPLSVTCTNNDKISLWFARIVTVNLNHNN